MTRERARRRVPRFHSVVRIDRPRDAVWPWLVEPDRLARWLRGSDRIELVGEFPPRTGSRYREVRGGRVREFEVVDVEAPERIVVRVEKKGVRFTRMYRVKDLGAVTEIEMDADAEAASLLTRLGAPFWVRPVRRNEEGRLERLKEVVEAAVPPRPLPA